MDLTHAPRPSSLRHWYASGITRRTGRYRSPSPARRLVGHRQDSDVAEAIAHTRWPGFTVHSPFRSTEFGANVALGEEAAPKAQPPLTSVTRPWEISLEQSKHRTIFRSKFRIPVAQHWSHLRIPDSFQLGDQAGPHYVEGVCLKQQQHPSNLELSVYLFEDSRPDLDPAGYMGGRDDDPALAAYLYNVGHVLGSLASDVVQLILWRSMTPGGPSISGRPGIIAWAKEEAGLSTQDLSWSQVPAGVLTARAPEPTLFELDRAVAEDVAFFLSHEISEPLAHDLLREAWRARHSNARAALIVGVAALETGIKQCAAQLAPDTGWLLEHVASPPLDRLLRDFLPLLPSQAGLPGGTVPPISKSTIKVVRTAIELRNRVAHGRADSVPAADLKRLLTVTHRLLYFFDFHCGHDWAKGPKAESPQASLAEVLK